MRNILLVGGAGGMGRAVLDRLAHRPDRIFVADEDGRQLEELAAPRGAQAEIRTFEMDITDSGERQEVLRELETVGPLDAAVILAAVHSAHPVADLPDEIIDRVLDVNLVSHVKLVRDLLPLVSDGGRLIAISTIAAGVGIPMSSLYSASKAGLEIFYESLSFEIAHRGIHCSLIHSSNVNTGFNEKGNTYGGSPEDDPRIEEAYRRILEKIHSRHGMDPDRVARVVVKALDAKKPRFCYVVGLNALKAHWCKRLLGREMTLKVMARFFGF